MVERENDYKCPKCGKACKNTGGLKQHMKVHESETEAPSIMKWMKNVPCESTAPKASDAAERPVKKKKVRQIPFKVKQKPQISILLQPKSGHDIAPAPSPQKRSMLLI